MSNNRGISVKILGRDLQITCPEGQEHELLDAAYYLDQTMQGIRRQGRVIGIERIAMMAALNIAHELLQIRTSRESNVQQVTEKLSRLHDKLEHGLKKPKRRHLLDVEPTFI